MKITREDILACAGKTLAIDTETTGLHWYRDGLIGIGIHCPSAGVSGYAHTCIYQEDFYGKPKKREEWLGEMDYSKSKRGRKIKNISWVPDKAVFAKPVQSRINHFLPAVHEICEDPNTVLIGHNLKFDAHFLGLRLWELPCKILDTSILTHLIDSNLKKSLAEAEAEFLGTKSKRKHVSKADKRFMKSPWMWGENVLEDYCTNDCAVTYQLAEVLMPKIREMDLGGMVSIQMKYLRLLQKIEWRGIKLEEKFCHQAIREFDKNISELEQELFSVCGREFNWRSSQQLSFAIYDGLGIKKPVSPFPPDSKNAAAKMYTKTATGTPLLLKIKHPARKEVIVLKETVKLKEYAEKYLILKDDEGVLHSSFNPTGAVTGRLSCVSGDTLLPTSRGIFRFDEYVPQVGDMVETHTGEWKPVLYKIFQGYQPVFQVCLSDGNMLKCTHNHRVLTPNGWCEVKNLSIGDEVYSYGNFQEIHPERRKYRNCSRSISKQSNQADNQRYSRTIRDDLSQCHDNYQYQCTREKTESRTSTSLLSVETSRQERHEGKNRREPSQLQRSDRRWTRLFDAKSRREICFRTPQNFCGVFRIERASVRNSGSSHRRRSSQQQYRQPSIGDQSGTCKAASKTKISFVTKIIALGATSTWDIGVSENESYLAQGFISHNCSDPNLQQLASRFRKYDLDSEYTGGAERVGSYNLRQSLVAREGYKIVSIDHKQQEARLLAILSQEPTLLKYMAERKDVHLSIAMQIWGDCGEKENKKHRDWSKATVFGLSYGMSPESLQEYYEKLEIDANAQEVSRQFFLTFPKLHAWFEEIRLQIVHDGGIRYWSGRYWFPEYPEDAYKGINAIIQGGAGDFLSVVLVRANQVLEAQNWGYLISIIHDEALFEIKEEFVETAAPVLARIMEGEDIFNVPFLTDIEIGDSYGSLHEFKTDVDLTKIKWKEYLKEKVMA